LILFLLIFFPLTFNLSACPEFGVRYKQKELNARVLSFPKPIYNLLSLSHGLMLNQINSDKLQDELYLAIRKLKLKRVKALIQKGANVNLESPTYDVLP